MTSLGKRSIWLAMVTLHGLPITFQMKCRRVSSRQKGGIRTLHPSAVTVRCWMTESKIKYDELTYIEAGEVTPASTLKELPDAKDRICEV